jgi:hypothetical protein
MKPFVAHDSIVRKIWGNSDTVLFIFAGAAAEFALNKAVDWLYFSGKLPADPIGRLFSTVRYARNIVFAPEEVALKTIDTIHHIHSAVEEKRGSHIPEWAYRDVLFMLIHYSIAAYELLNRRLSVHEKEEVYNVFYRLGTRMQVKDLPDTYSEWLPVREAHLINHLENSHFTTDLFKQYKKHLGSARYAILIEAQKLVVPAHVKQLLGFSSRHWLAPAVPLYAFSRKIKMDGLVRTLLLPSTYKAQIDAIDNPPVFNRE